jgi:hypothetical protein
MDMFQAHANEIIPGIWLGDYHSSQDETFLRSQHIDVVFNCTKNLGFSSVVPIKYRVPVDDNLEQEEIRNMSLWSSEIAFKIMREYMSGKRILVHCMAGRQRSAASVAFFIITLKRCHADEAIAFIKSKRSIAFFPSANFKPSIEHYDNEFHDKILPSILDKEDSEASYHHMKQE